MTYTHCFHRWMKCIQSGPVCWCLPCRWATDVDLRQSDCRAIPAVSRQKLPASCSEHTIMKDVAAKTNKSAITAHVAKENHVIDWSGAKILDKESHRKTRQLNELICICKEVNYMWTETGQLTTYQWPMTVFWSRAHHRHVTIRLMKFAVGKRNIAIRRSFFTSGCVIWM